MEHPAPSWWMICCWQDSQISLGQGVGTFQGPGATFNVFGEPKAWNVQANDAKWSVTFWGQFGGYLGFSAKPNKDYARVFLHFLFQNDGELQ